MWVFAPCSALPALQNRNNNLFLAQCQPQGAARVGAPALEVCSLTRFGVPATMLQPWLKSPGAPSTLKAQLSRAASRTICSTERPSVKCAGRQACGAESYDWALGRPGGPAVAARSLAHLS